MAHWHDFNPWAARLIYLPDLEEFVNATTYSPMWRSQTIKAWQGKKIDCYILPQPSGFHEMGIRYGRAPEDYISPLGDYVILQTLIEKYRGDQR